MIPKIVLFIEIVRSIVKLNCKNCYVCWRPVHPFIAFNFGKFGAEFSAGVSLRITELFSS